MGSGAWSSKILVSQISGLKEISDRIISGTALIHIFILRTSLLPYIGSLGRCKPVEMAKMWDEKIFICLGLSKECCNQSV